MSDTQICVTVTGETSEAIRRARSAAEAEADLVEVRLDTMAQPDVDAALAGRRKPVVVTCRPVREGGHFVGPEDVRLDFLRAAMARGAEYVDVEWDADFVELVRARRGRGVVVSRHLFNGMPADPAGLVRDLQGTGAEIAKLAVAVDGVRDLLALLQAAPRDGSAILIGMGPAGVASRVLARRFGSRWTYAGDGVAPGQMPVARLLHEYRFRRIREDAAIYGLIGRPIGQSYSPAMHNAGFAALGLNAVYVPLETTTLDRLRDFTAAIGLRGASITIPFKTDILPLLDEASPSAVGAGAANTNAIRNGRWVGINTDADGFLEPLQRRALPLREARVVVLGAGGAARAAGLALRGQGAEVVVSARRREAADAAARTIGGTAGAWPPPAGSWDVLVNATPVGTAAVPGLPIDIPLDGRVVYDLVYDPDPTPLMARAADAGCTVIGGLEMLIAQAERQFEIWTGQRPPDGLFAAAAARAQEVRAL
jgi:3-dehydroquinate dehydratase/shikimate dehydrogenase